MFNGMRKYFNNVLKYVLVCSCIIVVFASTSCDLFESKTVTVTTGTSNSSIRQALSTNEIVSKISPVVVYIINLGTGIVIDSSGYILTNNHVIDGENNLVVRFNDRTQSNAQIVYQNSSLDIAIIKCSANNLSSVQLGSSEDGTVGSEVIAVGYPYGSILGDSPTISKGIISSFRYIDSVNYIQTDTALNPGSSGSPLVNIYGEIIGLNTFGLTDTQGMNFAINLNDIKSYVESILAQLKAGGISNQTTTVTKTVAITVTVTSTIGAGQTVTVTKTLTDGGAVVTVTQSQTITNTVTASPTTVTQTQTVTQTITASPTITTDTVDGVTVFTYSGKGEMNTPPFSISSSPWVFQYTADWSGSFIVYLYQGSNRVGDIYVGGVTAGETYYTYIYDKIGIDLNFKIASAPSSGSWTIRVIQPN